MQKLSRIFIAGHRGLVGSAITRQLKKQGYRNLILKSRDELDLEDYEDTRRFFNEEMPEYVFVAAAAVGGIKANIERPVEFLTRNIKIAINVISLAYEYNVNKLLFLGSNCIYPKDAKQPLKEESLLDGKLEPTNEAYAIAKIAGIKLCDSYRKQYGRNFISVIPASLFGPNDNYDPESSHLIPSLIRKFHEAKRSKLEEVVLWGTGNPLREVMYVDDAADACIFMMKKYNEAGPINVGSGVEYSIADMAQMISKIVGYRGKIRFDQNKPDGIMRKILDSTRAKNLGWCPKNDIETALKETYKAYLKEIKNEG